ncbi:hypothetical protein [Secundilactobacillus yichangensis]|uniref:hypothetical protein n=1 Tax=Secundilactobacillus yichangensis TaxID=2799580 RepID=UPI001944F0EF|nr:hypothetical protein [Secundilactobacillus yichangensis]
MKIKQRFKIILVAFALTIAGAFASSQNASAKTKWTKGTPTALRGDWRAKTMSVGVSPFSGKESFQQYVWVGKSNFAWMVLPVDNPNSLIKTAYHHAKGSKNYYVKGTNDEVNIYDKFQVSGKKLRFCTYLTLNKKGHKTKTQSFCSKSYSHWLYKGQAEKSGESLENN